MNGTCSEFNGSDFESVIAELGVTANVSLCVQNCPPYSSAFFPPMADFLLHFSHLHPLPLSALLIASSIIHGRLFDDCLISTCNDPLRRRTLMFTLIVEITAKEGQVVCTISFYLIN